MERVANNAGAMDVLVSAEWMVGKEAARVTHKNRDKQQKQTVTAKISFDDYKSYWIDNNEKI
jgi:hypothetical protein